jgi:hypothetical protein
LVRLPAFDTLVEDKPQEESAMSTATETKTTEIVDSYLASLTEPNAARRAELMEKAWTPTARYVDPNHDLTGYAAFSGAIDGVVSGYPGFQFRRTTGLDAQHEYVRFGWEFVSPDGTAVQTGLDVGQLAGDGRLQTIMGFHGDPPAA